MQHQLVIKKKKKKKKSLLLLYYNILITFISALNLLEKLLAFDPTSRIGVLEALEHPYFELFHDPDDEVGQKKKKNPRLRSLITKIFTIQPTHSTIVDFSFESLDTVEEIKEEIIQEVKMFKARKHSLKLDMRGLRRHNR
jgi:mitogen-activated protein kinase 7